MRVEGKPELPINLSILEFIEINAHGTGLATTHTC